VETLQTFADRPVVVKRDGWTIYVAIHDLEYIRQRSEWKRQLAAVHTDRGGSAAAFRDIKQQQERWQATEEAWYATLGLAPPPFGTRPFRVRAYEGLPTRILTLLSDGRPRTIQEIGLDVGLTPSLSSRGAPGKRVHEAVCRLRARGAEIDVQKLGQAPLYRLVSTAQYRPPHAEQSVRRLMGLLRDGEVHRADTLCTTLHTSVQTLRTAVCRLRRRGAVIASATVAGDPGYQLLN
jgi:hypothetical protein